ncbi:MAG: PAS domain S-box protein [Chitinophagaceae bacterium]|nr:PAS domain S-box protein [Chitinophagaceae bacterium]
MTAAGDSWPEPWEAGTPLVSKFELSDASGTPLQLPDLPQLSGASVLVRCSFGTGRFLKAIVQQRGQDTWLLMTHFAPHDDELRWHRLAHMAEMPMENPNPVFRFSVSGEVLVCNPAAEAIQCFRVGSNAYPLDGFVKLVLATGANKSEHFSIEANCDGRVILFECRWSVGRRYINLYGTDVTEAKKDRRQLEESEVVFRSLTEDVPGAIFQMRVNHDGSRDYPYLSPHFFTIFNIDPALLPATGFRFLYPPDQERWQQSLQQAKERQEAWIFQGRLQVADGPIQWFRLKANVISRDQHGVLFTGYIDNVTDEVASKTETERLSLVARNNRNGIVFTDTHGLIHWVNDGFLKMTGYQAHEVIGNAPLRLCAGQLTDRKAMAALMRRFRRGLDFSEVMALYRKDGTWFWCRISGQPMAGEGGAIQEYFTMVEDISEQVKQEEQIKLLSRIAAENVNAVIIANADGQIEWVNKSFEQMTGYKLQEVVGKHPGRLLQGPASDKRTLAYLAASIRKRQPFFAEIINYSKTGQAYWVRIHGQPIWDSQNQLTGFFAIEEDVTAAKMNEQRLRESEALWRFALEGAGDGVWRYDLQTGDTFYSEQYIKMLGYDAAGFAQEMQTWLNLVHPDDMPGILQDDVDYRAARISSHRREYRIRHQCGHYIWVLDRGMVINYSADGQPKEIIGTHTDITRIKETELGLSQKIRQFESLSEGIPAVLYEYECRPDGSERLRYLSPSIKRIFGVEPSDFLNRYQELVHPEDLPRIRNKNKHTVRTLEPYYDESRLLMPDGSIRWRSVAATYSFTEPDGAKVFTGLMTDITDRKIAEDGLRLNEEKYRGIIANMNLGLLEVDTRQIIQFANQAFESLSGYTVAELQGKNAATLFVADASDLPEVAYRQARREEGKSDAYEIQVRDKNGQRRWWLISGAPRFNEHGEFIGSIGIHLDITAQKQLEQELRLAKAKAEDSARAKEVFLANMSHEIRTPMNAILGLSRQLRKTELNASQRLFLDSIGTASDNLLVIINDILDFSKVQAGKMALERITFEPAELLRKMLAMLQHRAEEKGLWLELQIAPDTPACLVGDPYRLQQVLINLVSNAIKFTEKGGVRVSVKPEELMAGVCSLQLVVSDTGIGIDESQLDSIFDPFTQEYRSTTRKYGGTGLGLSISKQLIELMGGTIKVESRKRIGTSFTLKLVLPVGHVADLPAEKTPASYGTLHGKRILLAEDNSMNRLVATTVLRPYGADIVEVENGQLALDAIQSDHFDLVLMDVQMPVMDGITATQRIRQYAGDELPIIALTANALLSEKQACFAAGMNDFVPKPFEEEQLVSKIAEWLHVNADQPAHTSKPAPTMKPTPAEERLYNLDQLQTIARGNESFVHKMIEMFLTQTPLVLQVMNDAAAAAKPAEMGAAAHKMKPSLDNLGISSLFQPIRTLERQGKEGDCNSAEVAGALQKVNEVLQKVLQQMRADHSL